MGMYLCRKKVLGAGLRRAIFHYQVTLTSSDPT